MKVLGQLETAQFENLLVQPSNLPIGRVWMDTSVPGAAVPMVWNGTTAISMQSGAFAGVVPVVQGGTGLTVPGASGNVLTSNGVAWVSAPPAGGGGGSGTVTSVDVTAPVSIFSVAGGPIIAAGTIAISLVTQNANQVWAGPAAGGPLAPSFRSLVAADLPVVPVAKGGTGLAATGADGNVLTALGGVWVSSPPAGGGGGGSVTSVALSLPAIFTVSGSPVTTAGTLTGTLATQLANKVWAGPTVGAAAAPTFRSLVTADLPVIGVAQGGTGLAAGGAAGNVLTSNGATWVSSPIPGASGLEVDQFTLIGGVTIDDDLDGIRVADTARTISKIVITMLDSGTSGTTDVTFLYGPALASSFVISVPASGGPTYAVGVPATVLNIGDFLQATITAVAAGAPESLVCKVFY